MSEVLILYYSSYCHVETPANSIPSPKEPVQYRASTSW